MLMDLQIWKIVLLEYFIGIIKLECMQVKPSNNIS